MSSKQAPSLVPTGPTPPKLTSKDLLRQFWADAYGKEVQSAATYSYMWLADQFGHICIGIILHFIATAFCGWAMAHLGFVPKWEYDTGKWPGLIIVVIVAAIWEWSAYSSSVKQATGRFPLDSMLQRHHSGDLYRPGRASWICIPLAFQIGPARRLDSVRGCNRSGAVVVAAENNLAEGVTALSVPSGRRCRTNGARDGRRSMTKINRQRRTTFHAGMPGHHLRADRIRPNSHGNRNRNRVCIQEP